jgi:hypothetical protein
MSKLRKHKNCRSASCRVGAVIKKFKKETEEEYKTSQSRTWFITA